MIKEAQNHFFESLAKHSFIYLSRRYFPKCISDEGLLSLDSLI